MTPRAVPRRLRSSTGTGTVGPARGGRRATAGSSRSAPGPTSDRAGPAPRWSTSRAGCSRPGFVDAHVHPSRAASSGSAATCPRRETPRGLPRHHRASTPPRTRTLPWILGGGWAMPAFPGGTPTAADLDAVVPDRPVFLPNRDHHGAWVNSRALELAGVDARHPGPGRTAGSSATPTAARPARCTRARWRWSRGTLPRRRPARTTTRRCWPARRYLHSLGVTGWQDAIVGAYAGMDDPAPTYLRGRRATAT